MAIKNKDQIINFIIEKEIANNIGKEHILAVFLHGSSTMPYIKINNRDLDFIVVTDGSTKIDKTFISTKFEKIKIEIFTYNYETFITSYCSLNNRVIPHYCYIKLLYTNNRIKHWPVPFDKKEPKIINAIIQEFLSKVADTRFEKNDKYFYWFLVWAKDLGANITTTEIIEAHDKHDIIDKSKYKWIVGFVKNKYKI